MKTKRKTFLVLAMLLSGGMVSAQVLVNGNVYGGCELGQVTGDASVTINGGTVGTPLSLQERVLDDNAQILQRVDRGNVYGGGDGYSTTGSFEREAGCVQGNTTVTIDGNSVVRRAVYGGGNMGTVGVRTVGDGGSITYTGGQTTVTIGGSALVGPKLEDLTRTPTSAELAWAQTYFENPYLDEDGYKALSFQHLGGNEGWVFGGSRGFADEAYKDYSFAKTTSLTIQGEADVLTVFGGGENGHVQVSTDVTIKGNAIVGGMPLHGSGSITVPEDSGPYEGASFTATMDETYEDEKFGVGPIIYRGNVFGGGKGTDFSGGLYSYTAGRVYGNTNVTVKAEGGTPTIYNRVFGGGAMASVGTFTYASAGSQTITGIEGETGHAYVSINGGIIGSNYDNVRGRNNGEVFGGSRGGAGRPQKSGETLSPMHQLVDMAYVGHTHVTVDGGRILHSVYGGGANGHVQGDANVLIKETTANTTFIGVENQGNWHSNVYGGGGGTAQYQDGSQTHLSITAGRVFGDATVNIQGGKVWHNVYGGGSLASVGTYLKKDSNNNLIPYVSGGNATVTITGGEIGYDGNENGMVFGSGRGEIAAPGNFLDSVTYVAYSTVNIGTGVVDPVTGTASDLSGNAKINGSVYGGGENGHVYLSSTVNVFSGTIGCSASEYASVSEENFKYRGNVYGAGCGTDMYASVSNGTPDTFNPNAGLVQGNTNVNIYGGYISRDVYGGGAMASVGMRNYKATVKHKYENNGYLTQASLSWPYGLTYISIPTANNAGTITTGATTIDIRGGHIGTVAAPVAASGNVFGAARGEVVGPLGVYDTVALVRTTEININFTPPTGTIGNETENCILGSVYGSGENGETYEDTKITLTNGRIVGSVFGGGQGTDTYSVQLKDPNDPTGQTYLSPSPQRSITAGKVYGNTEVNINGGIVEHNVFGGGNLASVGKGNYMGYGELSDPSITPSPTPYENSGICTVNITGGTIGTTGIADDASGNVNGFVFGSSKGITFEPINKNPRYDYTRDFFLGYANKTVITIGDPNPASTITPPTIYGSVFGGGEDGHVRWDTYVTVNKGTVGEAYVASNPETDSINKWVYRGNVYGAGRGIDKIASGAHAGEFCSSAGSVTLNTTVTVNGGTIHRNVYGGGSNASVGPPPTDYNPGTSLCTVNIEGGTIGQKDTDGLLVYGGHVFGAGRGHRDLLNTDDIGRFATSNETQVNIETGADVYGNVYGGGEIGQVKKDALVNMKNGTVEGSIFGGGKGEEIDEKAALVLGNATVDMKNGTVERSIYGGGQLGSVGTYTEYTPVTYPNTHPHNPGGVVNVPKTCDPATGLTTVKVSGGSVGHYGSLMPWVDHNPNDDDRGWIFCGGQGLADSINYYKAIALGVARSTYLEISNTSDDVRPLITASVYGGAENGLVLGDTHVKIMGGQIGSGLVSKTTTNPIVGTFDPIYDEAKWTAAIDAINNGTIATALASGGSLNGYFHECDAWTFASPYNVYDINADDYTSNGGALTGSDGHSFFGNVFGGGSGYYPIAPGVWRRTAGRVCGNTHVEITGGHILTSVYGGNETTDVMGKCTVTMSGGTLGVPRDSTSIAHHPTTCYLFGAGMGDARTAFNTWSNVNEVEVNVTGGTIFGSVFGGGEDGHVLGDAVVNIGCEAGKSPLIGTLGYSYVDGNVFGGGRGFQAFALTAGVVRGNIEVNIMGGTMLGSIYGGGRLASVGTYLVADNHANYGKMMADNGNTETHGHIKINIGYASNTGGTPMTQKSDITIGNDHESRDHYKAHNYGGNVYGGGMGRLEMLDGSTNDKWHQMGRVKNTVVNINQSNNKTTIIKGAVYGGGEMGTVGGEVTNTTDWHGTKVNISGGTLWFDVFGGGHGSDNLTKLAYLDNTTTVTPAQMAGRVFGNTNVNVSGGWIKKSIYGGGELASVGTFTATNDSIKHTTTTGYHESWPYQFNYVANTGIDSITITGGRIGITGKDYFGPWAKDTDDEWKPIYYSGTPPVAHFYDFTNSTDKENFKKACKDNGDIYGGSMGKVGSKYASAHWGNVSATTIEIEYPNNNTTPSNYNPSTTDMSGIKYMTGYYPSWSDWQTWVNSHGGLGTNGCIAGAVYGGAEDGHVNGDTKITLNLGLVGHAVYGGGKGKGKYTPSNSTTAQYSPTAGKVYGDTHITINGGYVVRSVFGGGNLASVGKGNYIGYRETAGDLGMTYAESSGRTYVNIYGGQLGTLNPSKPSDAFKDNIPYGSVFGGCRGLADGAVALNEHRFGFTNNTFVTIGETATAVTPGDDIYPHIYGSVYGGAQDGHVRRNTKVIVNDGEIGVEYGATPQIAHNTMGIPTSANLTTANLLAGNIGLDDPNWTDRGNVFGGGSGLGLLDEDGSSTVSTNYGVRAGCIFETAEVEIKGGLVHRGVYGGGNLASVLGLGTGTDHDKVKVTVSDYAKVGLQTDIAGEYIVPNAGPTGHDTTIYFSYGGNVFGAGKGFASDDFTTFCNVINTDVTISDGYVYGDVYGGGENGHVTDSTDVKITGTASVGILLPDEDGGTGTWGGTTTYDGNVFGGGMGSGAIVDVDPGELVVNEFRIHKHCGRVGGNTHVKMDGGTIQGTIFGGGRLALVGVDENGEITAFANETTHVYDSVSATTGKHGLATIEVSGTASIGNPDGYKLLNESDESVGDIFGSGKGDVKNYQDIMAGRVANSKIRISDSPRIYGSVFGGGEMASIGYYYEGSSTYEGTSIHKQVFYDKTGTSDIAISGNPEIGTDTEFTSAYAATHPDWTVYDTDGSLIHTCTGNVFGGAQGDVNINKRHWVSMAKSKQSKVVINGGTIKSRVFGGAEQGSVAGNTRVEINGGTIGTYVTSTVNNLPPYYYGGVLGGGYGSHREDYNVLTHQNDSTAALGGASGTLWRPDYLAGRVYGNARVDVLGGTIKGNVFGGAAYAYLGGYGSSPKGDVLVNIGNESTGSATFYGSVFGANNRSGTPYGNVNVNVYHTAHRTWTDENNVQYTDFAPTLPAGLEWTPDLLNENINGTGHFENIGKQRYAIKQVFGGGNWADFTPNSANRTVVPRSTTVHVYYCENTIEDLYGGGNAADIGTSSTNGSANSNVEVDGGRFYRVFGGGNGLVEPANIYGTASTEINAGVIQEVYGGGNSNGFIDNINLEITNANADVCDAFIYDVFGGNNEAEIIGDIVSVINCGDGYQHEFYGANNNATIYGNVTTNVFGGTTDFLFGGSKGSSQEAHIRQFPSYAEITADQALPANQRKYSQSLLEYMNYDPTNSNIFKTELVHTKGNVTLNIFGGEITQAAFGGSDVNGTIDGKIQVNVFDAQTGCPLYLNNLYGAGRNTDYIPIYDLPEGTTEYISPEINVIHGTVKGNVYGGGQGETAITTASPEVNIGYYADLGVYGHEGDLIDKLFDTIHAHTDKPNLPTPYTWTPPTDYVVYIGSNTDGKGEVYGGGNAGKVIGNTYVNINKANTTNASTTIDGYVFGGGYGATATVEKNSSNYGNTSVTLTDGWVKKDLFGGGNAGNVANDVAVTMSGGKVGKGAWPLIGFVFGGAKQANIGGDVTVNYNGGEIRNGLFGGNDESGNINGQITVNVLETNSSIPISIYSPGMGIYGGGRNAAYSPTNGNLNSPVVNFIHGNIEGCNVFGGGYGTDATVTANPVVNFGYNPATIPSSLISGLNPNDFTVVSNKVFGGGQEAAVLGNTLVRFSHSGSKTNQLFGGGYGDRTNAAVASVTGHCTVNISDGQVGFENSSSHVLTGGVVCGGGDYAQVTGNTKVVMSGGTVKIGDNREGGHIYGGGHGDNTLVENLGHVGGNSYLTIANTARIEGDAFGGGNTGTVSGDTYVTVKGGELGTTVVGTGTTGGDVYGGGKGFAPTASQLEQGQTYAQFANHGVVLGNTYVYVRDSIKDGAVKVSPLIHGIVYGGGEEGSVGTYTIGPNAGLESGGTTNVTVTGGTIGPLDGTGWNAYVFGGSQGMAGDVAGNYRYHATVGTTNVTIDSAALVCGSVLGGGAEGHVWNDANVTVLGGTIGTTGYALGDGSVLGGGGNQSESNLSAGRVGGNVNVNIRQVNAIYPTHIKGNVYGGGYAGRVGVNGNGEVYTDDLAQHGNVTMNITGGTIGILEYTQSQTNGDYDGIDHHNTGSVFGGGKGSTTSPNFGLVSGNTTVTIGGGRILNNVYGGGEMGSVGQHTEDAGDFLPVANTGLATVTVNGGQVGPAPKVETGYNLPISLTGTDGYVFGGGKGDGDDPISIDNDPDTPDYPYGQYYQFANVNNTMVTVNITSADTINNRIWGSVFGGAEDGHVLGSNTVKYQSGYLGTKGTTSYDGNIFGGGRNYSHKNYTAGRTRGNNTIEMTGGQIYGNIYGGGRLALTGIDLFGRFVEDESGETGAKYGKTLVQVKGGTIGNNRKIDPTNPDSDLLIEIFTTYSMGNVYGGGMGTLEGIDVAGHPKASSLLFGITKNTVVEISEEDSEHPTHVYGIVFGGGEKANVGKYTWTQNPNTFAVTDIDVTEGKAIVNISGGTIGADRAKMRYQADAAPYNMYPKYNDDLGYVYGAGEGVSEDPAITASNPLLHTARFGNLSLIDLTASVYETEVNISGGWVKASVFGGSESGHVMSNTKVNISGGTIGAGNNIADNKDEKYTDDHFADPSSTTWYPTAHWNYTSPYHPYDPVFVMNGTIPCDGRSWFGNVFGGGSGWFPYIKKNANNEYQSYWNANSGKVWGDTEVNITGGHILNNVYGANESTDVGNYAVANAAYYGEHPEVHVGELYCTMGGTATVKISGGTVGMPLSENDYSDRPLLGNVFGGGAGDPRLIFNDKTNVDTTDIQITGGTIYGSVFGGAEQGHVVRGTSVSVNQASNKTVVIGTTGFSGYDGHVFGGGKGDETIYEKYPKINGTETTPEVPAHPNFACGRVGGTTKVTMTKGTVLGNLYGGGFVALTGVGKEFTGTTGPTGDGFWSFINSNNVYDSIRHGKTQVVVNGGTIGNPAVGTDGIPLLLRTSQKVGNVYGGGCGKLDEFREDDFGRSANAIVTINNSPTIYGSVFGGGEMANVGHWNNYVTWYTTRTGTTKVTITGSPTIGTAKEFNYAYATGTGSNAPIKTVYETVSNAKMLKHTSTGNVFGGGEGNAIIVGNYAVGLEQGHCRTSDVNIGGTPTIMACVFGGSEEGALWGDAHVKITGGTIGTSGITAQPVGETNISTYSFGSVFGGSYGVDTYSVGMTAPEDALDSLNRLAGRVYGDAYVTITGGSVLGNVFGGGHMASMGEWDANFEPAGNSITGVVMGKATVKVEGSAVIGPLDDTGLNAYVFGGGKGVGNDPNGLRKRYANVNSTEVTANLGSGHVDGSLFGGGSDGHVLGNAAVTLSGGTIGTNGTTSWDGNIFGGGRNYHESGLTAGRVGGNITVTMTGGTLKGNIYGGGRQGLTGVGVDGVAYTTNTANHGNITVNVSGGTIGTGALSVTSGHVYGGGKGQDNSSQTGYDHNRLGEVRSAAVTIEGDATVNGSVFGGSENGWVLENTSATIAGTATIGHAANNYQGNVFGGGRGIKPTPGTTYIPEAGLVKGESCANVNGGTINRHVFGGGNSGIVEGARIVNVSGGTVNGDVYGGSNSIPDENATTTPPTFYSGHGNLKTVNVFNGHIIGNVYGCSNNANEGVSYNGQGTAAPTNTDPKWTAFVNIMGGTIDESVYGAGYEGVINGSVCVLVGKNAILSTPDVVKNANTRRPADNQVVAAALDIKKDIYAGSNFYGTQTGAHWRDFDVQGFSNIYIDGDGYKTGTSGDDPEMYVRGSLFGSGTNCEAGKLGRNIVLRNYGKRQMLNTGDSDPTNDSLVSVTRTMTSIQRVGNFYLENANIALTGLHDIKYAENAPLDPNYGRIFGAFTIDTSFVMCNGSSIVLGTDGAPARIDSVYVMRSVRLDDGIYSKFFLRKLGYTWIGVRDSRRDDPSGCNANLYYNGETTALNRTTQENVILFKDRSQLFVRYHIGSVNQYGELQGFFRMSSLAFKPHDDESFAYARQKDVPASSGKVGENLDDGGFVSYKSSYNFHTDHGHVYTNTKQYPYTNVVIDANPDLFDCRGWYIPEFIGNRYYVDGTRGWGKDEPKTSKWGLYPDMPKLTVNGGTYSVMQDNSITGNVFDPATDIIYVVGAISSTKEWLHGEGLLNRVPSKQLRIYRYPGGHEMSNKKYDLGDGTGIPPTSPYNGLGPDGNDTPYGPGPCYGSLLVLEENSKQITLENVLLDGLYGIDADEMVTHQVNLHGNVFKKHYVNAPLVTAFNGSTLLMKGARTLNASNEIVTDGTILKRGYNNHDASANLGTAEKPYYNFYRNPDYTIKEGNVINGGGIYASYTDEDNRAIVKVEGKVTVYDNYQKEGNVANDTVIRCNVYLPDFMASIVVSGTLPEPLDQTSMIGVTSPNRNTAATYVDNTFSPVAVASDATLAELVWTYNNIRDDQQWFFSNYNERDTYYHRKNTGGSNKNTLSEKTLYFGWTWANVVRKQPATGDLSGEVTNDFSPSSIDSPYDLAWLISKTSKMNRTGALSDFTGQTIKQTKDFNLKQYVWVPIGNARTNGNGVKYKGKYDGQGHLIDGLYIEYLGLNDNRYQRQNYGLFGVVNGDAANNGVVERTFVVGGEIQPESDPTIGDKGDTISRDDTPYYIGGLVGCLEGVHSVISSSEAALKVDLANVAHAVVGGLVGRMTTSEIHSSMAMPEIDMPSLSTEQSSYSYLVGGLVGSAEGDALGSSKVKIYNSFVNAKFDVGNITGTKLIGGLVGNMDKAEMKNCYMTMHDTNLPQNTSFDGIVNQVAGSAVDYCYVMPGASFDDDNFGEHCANYTAVISADNLGYQYYDNVIPDDTTLVARLNMNAYHLNKAAAPTTPSIDSTYAHWARPSLDGINGDLPVLLLGEFDETYAYQGGFRSVGTYAGGPALQYGGPARDGTGHDLSDALKRQKASTANDYLFVYGDVSESTVVEEANIKQTKVSIYENASITNNNTLKNFANTYVGITFDNSCGHAQSTYGVNYGLNGWQNIDLPRDYHMFSTPLSNAPLGFDYNITVPGDPDPTTVNTNTKPYANGVQGDYYNNPWVNQSLDFSWLNGGVSGDKRYWMADGVDGYFPTSRGNLFDGNVEDLFILGSDEHPASGRYRYPYGMDFYTWTEPDYHWINFKRNGPNHWHTDGDHDHINYRPSPDSTHYKNEDVLIPAKGYLGSITKPTFMQSHGTLNQGDKTITLTVSNGSKLPGWNLVGNPYHGYIDFAAMVNSSDAANGAHNASILAKRGGNPFYVVYDADSCKTDRPGTGFLYYPDKGSTGGHYAGRYIHPHQGFYVKLDATAPASNTLNFDEGMLVPRSAVKESHFRSEEPAYPLVNLFLSSDKGCRDVTVIEFERPEWGGATKLKELRVGNGQFYAHHDDNFYAALFAEKGIDRVPVWFEAKEDDIFTLKWNTANGDFQSMYLIDNITGIQYDMLRNDTYVFEGHKSDYWSRFLIVFNVTDVDEHEINNFVFFDGSEYVVTGEGDLDFVDVLGHVLMHTHVDGGQTRVRLPKVAPAVYLMRLTNGKECMVQKIVVK